MSLYTLLQSYTFSKRERIEKELKSAPLETLHKLKVQLDDKYYNDESDVPDEAYDLLKDVIVERDKTYVPPVGAKLREGENRATLPYWLGSADKITPEKADVFERWLSRNRTKSYVISDKLDGVSCLLVATKDKVNLYTRGDGYEGADISYLQRYFPIPKLKQNIAVRGELIVPKRVFETKYVGTYKNPRNMVSGLIGSKTSREGLKDVHFVAYEIITEEESEKPQKQLERLNDLGFETVTHKVKSEISIPILENCLEEMKKESKYEIDGIIVQSNTEYERNTDGNPKYMFAFKMLSTDAIQTTKVLGITWQVSKWGALKPVVHFEPVEYGGVTMSNVTAHNAKYVYDNKIGKGAVIRVVRSNEVIPYIVDIVKQAESPDMPKEEYIWDDNHVNISVANADGNSEICIKLMANFFDKLGIKHVAVKTIEKMYENGLTNLLKIIKADEKRLLQVPEFQQKSANRIYVNIRAGLKKAKLSTILGACGIFGFGIGEKRMTVLLEKIPNLLELHKTKTPDEIKNMVMRVDGFSDIIASKIATNVVYADKFISALKEAIGQKENFVTEQKTVSNVLKDQKFVMTGFRDKTMEEQIVARGGKVMSSVSGATTGVIVATKPDQMTGKLAKAVDLKIPIYSKAEFVSKFLT